MEGKGNYRGWTLLVREPYEGMAVYFILSPGYDPVLMWGLSLSYDLAVVNGRRRLIKEAKNEQSSRGRS